MKFILATLITLSSVSALAAATVKITSYTYVNGTSANRHAELCGLVEGAETTPSYVRVLVDPGSRNPGSYNTIADADGKFCMSVVTYRGTATANLFGQEPTESAIAR